MTGSRAFSEPSGHTGMSLIKDQNYGFYPNRISYTCDIVNGHDLNLSNGIIQPKCRHEADDLSLCTSNDTSIH